MANRPITVAHGDGIGPEIMNATLHILKEAGARTVTLDVILAEPDRLSPEAFARLYADVPELAAMIGPASMSPSSYMSALVSESCRVNRKSSLIRWLLTIQVLPA